MGQDARNDMGNGPNMCSWLKSKVDSTVVSRLWAKLVLFGLLVMVHKWALGHGQIMGYRGNGIKSVLCYGPRTDS